ncbi:hypothetical protein SEPCBS119000_000756 [Sporothrix epigloea]|uniref:Uncharacterized protein n=1 Tax=Sporothrix epigloea TaxID=1892477 RepID=A0ABP0DAR4_9PEZI
MLPHKKTSEVIDLTNEPEPEPKADLKSEILSMSAHKPRPPPLAYKHSSQSQSHSQPQNQTRAQQEHFSAILGQPDFVPVTSSFDGQLLRTSASISYPAASKSPRAPIGLEMFCSRRYSVSGIPANLTGSGSSKPAATGTTSKPAGSNTQLEPDDQTTRPLRDSTELASPLCQPSGQSAPSWSFERLESAAEKRAAAAPAALSTRPSVFDSSDKHLAQLSQKLSARRSFGNRSSTASTHSSPTKSRGQTIPSLPAHFGKVRSPPLAADSSQQQQSLSMQHHETCLDCHRQSLRQFAPSRASALSNDLLYYQRQTMSFWDTQMRDQQQFRQRAHEAEAQRNNSHRQAERQRQLEQQKRQEQQELWRAREMQLIEERVQREKHTEQQLQQQESQEQQQQDKTQRLQQLQRQQHQQQQHLANAYAQAQTQQQHHIFHFSASANRIDSPVRAAHH